VAGVAIPALALIAQPVPVVHHLRMATPPPADATLVIWAQRGSRRYLGRQPRLALLVFAGVEVINLGNAALAFVRAPRLRVPFLVLASVVTVVSAGVALWIRRRVRARMHMFVAPDRVGYQGLGRRLRVVPRTSLRSVRRVSAHSFARGRSAQLRGRYLLFLGEGGRSLLRVVAENFADADVDHLLSQVGVPVEGDWSDLDTAKHLRQRFPGSFPWLMAHAVVLTLLIVVVVAAASFVAALVIAPHAGSGPS
jgi:hypothetical protein